MQTLFDEPAPDIRRTSDLLRELVLENPRASVTLGEILKTLDDRAFGFMMFLLAFPVCLPMPPGFSTLMGFLILPIAFQFLLGRARPQLPDKIRDRPIDRAALAKAINIIMPALRWLEKIFRPRWYYVTHGIGEKISGVIILVLIFVLITPLPPPLHLLPASGIALMALGIMERDGAIVVAGAVVGIGGLTAVGVMGKIIFRWIKKAILFFHASRA
jgi:hypothetical protein